MGINSSKCLTFYTATHRMYFLMKGDYSLLGSLHAHKRRESQKEENIRRALATTPRR